MKQELSNLIKNHFLIIIPSSLVFLTVVSFLVLSVTKVSADPNTVSTSNSSTASVTVSSACSMTSTVNTEHEATIPNGIYSGDSNYYPSGIGQTTLKTTCNDGNGFSIYAIGFTNDIEGENKLVGTNSNEHTITTGTATSGTTSNWAMKVATDTTSTYPMTISSDSNGSFSSHHIVPSEYTKVAYRTSGTDVPTSSSSSTNATGSILTTTYAAFISSTQVADTYHGKDRHLPLANKLG